MNRNLFEEEIQAWKYGPVIPSIYYEFKNFTRKIITKKSNEFKENGNTYYPKIFQEDIELEELLTVVWKIIEKKSGVNLIKLTHKRNTPWSLFYNPSENNIIKKDIIKRYYKALLHI